MDEKNYSLRERARMGWSEDEEERHRKHMAEVVQALSDGTYVPPKRKVYTGVDRLAYYRSHGLTCCGDYPGGDSQFEQDVLSGEYRDERVTLEPLKREDAYIIQCFRNKRLKVTDSGFLKYGVRPEVEIALYDSIGGIVIHRENHPEYTYAVYREEVLSGEYARKHCSM